MAVGEGAEDSAVAVGEGAKDSAVAVGEGAKDSAVAVAVGEGAEDSAVAVAGSEEADSVAEAARVEWEVVDLAVLGAEHIVLEVLVGPAVSAEQASAALVLAVLAARAVSVVQVSAVLARAVSVVQGGMEEIAFPVPAAGNSTVSWACRRTKECMARVP